MQGGEIILCDKCPNAFSRMAIQRNLGRAKMQEITAADEWKCPECDPKQIYEQQALYWAVWQVTFTIFSIDDIMDISYISI